MYTDWFKLKRLPFRLRPDPEFLYLCGETAAAFETLRAASSAGRGAIALIGDSGVGKTTLLHTIAHQRQGAMSVARIQQPNLTSQGAERPVSGPARRTAALRRGRSGPRPQRADPRG
jgi:general secretion pathway protein A